MLLPSQCPWPRRDQPCDVTWHAVSFYDQPDIFSGQVNKFPGSLEVFHKVNLFRQLELMKQMYPDDFNFFPRTWLLPQQYHEFSNDVRHLSERRGRHKPTFIIKPSEGSQGEGIYLIRDPQQYSGPNNRSHVAQEYLANVLLLDGFKFDLRVYAVLRSLDPLEVHICHEGLARFSTVQYEQPSNRNLGETYMHLTNYSLNKRSATFDKSEKEDEGSKRKLTSVFRRLQRMGYDTQRLWVTIERIVCKTLMAVIGELKVELQSVISPCKPHPTCFQVLGFDILLLKDLRPVLLEVNSNPSLSIMGEQEVAPGIVEYIPSIKDEEVKRALIRDTLILIAPKNKKTRRRRKKRHHRTQVTVEDMEVDPPPSIKLTRHRNRKRERDISIRIVEEDPPVPETVKSIFAENQPRPLVRQETCRVFHEAQGEQTNVESPPMPPSPHLRGPVFLDAGDQHLPALTQQQSPTGGENKQLVAFMEGDVDISSQPLPNYPYPESSEDEDGEEEEESCLKEIYPALYADDLQHLRVMDRLADVFIGCLSVRGCSRMGPTAFRMFARKCRLNKKGLTNASIDILYIDVKRKWEMLNPDMTAGLSFHGFVDICFEIARRKFHTNSKAKMMEELVSYCEENMKHRAVEEEVSPTRLSAQMSRVPKRSVNLFPRRTITSLEEETEKFFPRRITSLEEDTDNSSFQVQM
ncbi:hypothetical protein C0Q70_17726 [Pomacea canaliculata]|uniref:Tubulin polyglutamylase TTLL11 n=1 Tax=Pomacea canaliculata TaxID=400727 RepID=A0A2T7NL82_POMCA|nr:hypothetical protein C0Q70_17726 [Pomacea canaliculata]